MTQNGPPVRPSAPAMAFAERTILAVTRRALRGRPGACPTVQPHLSQENVGSGTARPCMPHPGKTCPKAGLCDETHARRLGPGLCRPVRPRQLPQETLFASAGLIRRSSLRHGAPITYPSNSAPRQICSGGRRKIAKKIAKNKRLLCQHLATPLKDAVEGDEGGLGGHYPLGHLRRGVDQSQRYGRNYRARPSDLVGWIMRVADEKRFLALPIAQPPPTCSG